MVGELTLQLPKMLGPKYWQPIHITSWLFKIQFWAWLPELES